MLGATMTPVGNRLVLRSVVGLGGGPQTPWGLTHWGPLGGHSDPRGLTHWGPLEGHS